MNIIFKELEIVNFMSFREESFDFSAYHGINLICGINNDIPESKNGAGKCLDKDTLMTIETDEDIYEKLVSSNTRISAINKTSRKRISISIIEIYKFLKIFPKYLGRIDVLSRFGLHPIDACEITARDSEVYKITTESGKILKASPDHLLFNEKHEWSKIKELKPTNKIFTYDGLEKIKSITLLNKRSDLYDIQVRDVHEFYANGIISHNSNILNALVFNLFGKTINDIDKEHIPHRLAKSKDKCEVALNVEVENVKYRIIRGIKNKSKYCELFKFDNDTSTYIDITKSGMKETQKIIEKEILKCNISLFLRSILLTADQSYNFFKLKKEQKCEFIEQIFDLIVFGVMYDILHKDILKLDKEIYALNREVKILEDQLLDCDIKKTEYDASIISKKENIEKTITELKNKLQAHIDNTQDFSKELAQYLEEKEKNYLKIEKLTSTQKTIKEKYHLLDKNIEQLKLKITQNDLLINKHSTSLKLLCVECFKIIDNFYKISELKDEIEKYKVEQETLTADKAKNSTLYTKLNNAIKQLQVLNNELVKKHTDLVNILCQHDKTSSKIKTEISNNEFLLTSLNREVNPYIESHNTLTEKVKNISESLDKANTELLHLKYVEKLISPDMLRKLIIKDLIQYLNNRIHLYICRMGAKFTCVFDENLHYTFYTDSGETSYENFSSGERMRLSIATSFAFRDFMSIRSGINANILVLDEYLDSGLDSSAIINLMSILKEFSIINHYDIYIVSHRKEISDTYFNNIITVEKTNDVSKINKEVFITKE